MNQDKLTHFDEDGNPSMVDINSKNMTKRVAIASGKIKMQSETLKKILNIKIKKGDVLTIAKIAGIMMDIILSCCKRLGIHLRSKIDGGCEQSFS